MSNQRSFMRFDFRKSYLTSGQLILKLMSELIQGIRNCFLFLSILSTNVLRRVLKKRRQHLDFNSAILNKFYLRLMKRSKKFTKKVDKKEVHHQVLHLQARLLHLMICSKQNLYCQKTSCFFTKLRILKNQKFYSNHQKPIPTKSLLQ